MFIISLRIHLKTSRKFGEPFFLIIHEGKTLAEVKVRIQKKLQVPDDASDEFEIERKSRRMKLTERERRSTMEARIRITIGLTDSERKGVAISRL
ncbi:hypothetical protein Scep_004312 [Stephania cephalantha]|uniref:Uncharacterized protein n=1 Tax=Stephania cephalantha TaxID=152367 RepID=A0AAP0KS85_9MAGN